MNIIDGYVVNTTNFVKVQEIIKEIGVCVLSVARKSYKKLLEYEIECAVDGIATNKINMPTENNIFSLCKQDLKGKIDFAGNKNLLSPYNFNVMISCFVDEVESKTYFHFICTNNLYSKELEKIKDLEPFSVEDSEFEDKFKFKKWQELFLDYESISPLTVSFLSSVNTLDVFKPEDLEFAPVAERIERQVRYSLTNTILNSCSMGQPIKPFQLMPFFDLALKESLSDTWSKIRQNQIITLKKLIVPITVEMIDPKTKENQD